MLVPAVRGLVVRAPAAEVDLLDEALVDEQVEDPVDARDPDLAAAGAEPRRGSRSRSRRSPAAERLDDRAPRGAEPVARACAASRASARPSSRSR